MPGGLFEWALAEFARSASTALAVAASSWSLPRCPDCYCSPALSCPSGQAPIECDARAPSSHWSTLGLVFIVGLVIGASLVFVGLQYLAPPQSSEAHSPALAAPPAVPEPSLADIAHAQAASIRLKRTAGL